MNRIAELQAWYASHCNGEWEHGWGVTIETVDNPGWSVEINLTGTELGHAVFVPRAVLHSDSDWITCEVAEKKVVGKVFRGHGDPSKLEEILGVFLDWAQEHRRVQNA